MRKDKISWPFMFIPMLFLSSFTTLHLANFKNSPSVITTLVTEVKYPVLSQF